MRRELKKKKKKNLLKVALLAGALFGVLVVNDVQRRLPLFQLQAFNFCLQLVQLLLQVLALLHVLHPEHGHNMPERVQLIFLLTSYYTATVTKTNSRCKLEKFDLVY